MSQAGLPNNSIIPVDARWVEDGVMNAHVSPKTKRLMDNAMATLEKNVRWFLETHCGIIGAQDLDLPREDLDRRMEIMNVKVVHMRVEKKPKLNGVWIVASGKPKVSFTDPVIKNGKPFIQMIDLGGPAIITPGMMSPGELRGTA